MAGSSSSSGSGDVPGAAAVPTGAAAGDEIDEDGLLHAVAARLRNPLDVTAVRFRTVGGARQVGYLPGDQVIAITNDVFGFHRWADEIRKMELDYCVQVRCTPSHDAVPPRTRCPAHATLPSQDSDSKWNVGVYAVMRVYFVLNGAPVCWREDVGYGSATRQPHLEMCVRLHTQPP